MKINGVALSTLLFALSVGSSALASNPFAAYVSPRKVERLDDRTVVIHGNFFFYQSSNSYSKPTCGYAYLVCPDGKTDLCKTQWDEIEKTPDASCTGFGQLNMVASFSVRAEGTPLKSPDLYDLGTGTGIGSYVYNQCQAAVSATCVVQPVWVDAGTDSMADSPADTVKDVSSDGSSPTTDSSPDGPLDVQSDGGMISESSAPDGSTSQPDVASGKDAAEAVPDAIGDASENKPVTPATESKSGCHVEGSSQEQWSGGLAGTLALLGLAFTLRRKSK